MIQPYSKPGHFGGQIIRQVIQCFKEANVTYPLTSHILIACSGGCDSTALAILAIKYGRKIGPKSNIRLVHINHGWRGEESDADALFVEQLGRQVGVETEIFCASKEMPLKPGQSLEDHARQIRKRIFSKLVKKYGKNTRILTAHHAEDLAETVIWRFFTGTGDTHGAGILVQYKNELRPLLRVRKAQLKAFLKEEGISWREDRTNHESRFLRSRIRQSLIPVVEELFPKAVYHLLELGLNHDAQIKPFADKKSQKKTIKSAQLASVLQLRRPHWLAIEEKMNDPTWYGEIILPGGWSLSRKRKTKSEVATRNKNRK